MQFDEASNQRTDQATIDEGGREQQQNATLSPPSKLCGPVTKPIRGSS